MVASLKNKILKYNLHTHSAFCDGIGSIEEHCIFSINTNFNVLGFSCHAPLKFNNSFSIPQTLIPKYLADIDQAKDKHNGTLKILKGLECDFIPGLSLSFNSFKEKYQLDYIIGGIHLVGGNNPERLWFIDGPKREFFDNGLSELYQNDIQKAVTNYFHQMNEMIETEKFDILAHFDKIKMHNQSRFFEENEKWYENLIQETLELVVVKDLIVELNYRGIYKKRCHDFYPSKSILKKILHKKIRVCISSDAHQPHENGILHEEANKFLKEIGFTETYCLNEIIPL